MPKEIQQRIDTETSLKRLEKYEEFIAFVETYATSCIYNEKKPAQQLSDNKVAPVPPHEEPPPCSVHSVEEWINFLGTPEGEKFVEEGGEMDQNGHSAYFAIMKGVPKGGGRWNKGDTKGGYRTYTPKMQVPRQSPRKTR